VLFRSQGFILPSLFAYSFRLQFDMKLAMTLSEPVIAGLRLAGPAFFLSMQGSSVQIAAKIASNRSVGSLSALPFVSLLTNCVIWTYYGVIKNDKTVFIPNGIGILAGAGCVAAYHRYAPKAPTAIYAVAAAVIALCTFLFTKGNYQLLGYIGCILAVVLSGSPLATLKTVVKDKSTASLPFLPSLTTWLNALSWASYGLLVAHDPMIYGPNLMGFSLASIQLLLFAVFGFAPASTPAAAKKIF